MTSAKAAKARRQVPQENAGPCRRSESVLRRVPKSRNGAAVVETVMWIPIFILFLFGIEELARVSYTYFTLTKILYTVARGAGVLQGPNFCDSSDQSIIDVKNLALRGSITDTGTTIIPNVTADSIAIRIERYDPASDSLIECDCSNSGCDAASGGLPPDYLVVYFTNGYPIKFTFPGLNLDPIPLQPQIRIPYGGT